MMYDRLMHVTLDSIGTGERPIVEARLEKARVLEDKVGIPRGTLYKLARQGQIPYYRVGPKLTGVRFVVQEVMQALRRPVSNEKK